MTIAKPPKVTPTIVTSGKAVLDKPVVKVDKRLQDCQQIHLADLIGANTRGVLTLFPRKPRKLGSLQETDHSVR